MNFVRKLVSISFLFAFGLSVFPVGYYILPRTQLTATTILLLIGAICVVYMRRHALKPIFPAQFFKIPAVIATCVYLSIGLFSGFFAVNKFIFFKDIVQKITIVILPLYLFSMGPRTIEDLKKILLIFLPFGLILSFIGLFPAVATHFEEPSYGMGMHKNHIGGCCASMAIICVALLVTTARPRMKTIAIALLAVAVLGVVASQSRAGLASFIIASFLILIRNRAKPKHLLIMAAVTVIGGLLLYFLLPEKAIEHVVTTKKWSANGIRMMQWSELIPRLLKDPLTMRGWGNPMLTDDGWCFGDGASVVLADWIQLGIFGAIALVSMMCFSAYLPWSNANRIGKNEPLLAFINLSVFGIIVSRFACGLFDTFWIGRGVMLHTWTAIGIAVFIRLMLDQRDAAAARISLKRRQVQTTAASHSRYSVSAPR